MWIRNEPGRRARLRVRLELYVAVLSLVVATLAPAAAAGGASRGSRARPSRAFGREPPVAEIHTPEEALAMDAEQLARDLSVTPEEAYAYLELQPLVGDLREYLADVAGSTFSDLYIDYNPYRIVILSQGTGDDESASLSADARFQDLLPFLEVQHVEYTEALLVKAMEQIGLLAGEAGQASDADIRTGTVTVWVDSEASARALMEAVQKAEESGDLPVPPDSVEVLVGGGVVFADSFAGNALNKQNGAAECTSGFSVEQTGGGTLQGVSTAQHCADNLELANGDDVVFQAQRGQGSAHVQWHTTPGHTDQPWMRDGPTSVRNVTARKTRSNMSVGEAVCKYGRITGYTCGTIESKNFDLDTGSTYNATFIRVDDGNDTLVAGGTAVVPGTTRPVHMG